MRARYPHLEYDVEDCTTMGGQGDGSFQAVVDKGLLVRALSVITKPTDTRHLYLRCMGDNFGAKKDAWSVAAWAVFPV